MDEVFSVGALLGAARKPKGKKMRASTLKRLTVVPPHKVRHDNRHFPAGALSGGGSSSTSTLGSLKSDLQARPASAQSDDEPAANAQERRKRFLTMSNLKRVFRTLDLSDDGFIDVDEIFAASQKLGGNLTREEIVDVVWEVDDDRDGRLSMSDYLTTYRRSANDESGLSQSGSSPSSSSS